MTICSHTTYQSRVCSLFADVGTLQVRFPIDLCSCFEMTTTGLACGTTEWPVLTWHMLLPGTRDTRGALRGTETHPRAPGMRYAVLSVFVGYLSPYAAATPCPVPKCFAVSGTELAFGATRDRRHQGREVGRLKGSQLQVQMRCTDRANAGTSAWTWFWKAFAMRLHRPSTNRARMSLPALARIVASGDSAAHHWGADGPSGPYPGKYQLGSRV
eukprot:1081768-Rhodomonas_salina.2